ncbi:hypothetical protein GMMP1_990029 [Candidatus Magnetomoraceae bacterium gMMP-1]
MKNLNPYISRGPLYNQEMFFGRKEEKELIFQYLIPLENVSIVGEPKIGKSSLLIDICRKDIYKNYLDNNYKIVYVDLQSIGEVSLENFFLLIKEALEKIDIKKDFKNPKSFREFIDEYNNEDNKLIICLDEFEVLTNSNLDISFYSFLRGIGSKRNCVFVIASRHYLTKICPTTNNRDSELWNIFQLPLILKGLTKDEAKELIKVPFKKAEKKLPISPNKILKLTGCSPFNIVTACKHIFNGVEDLNELKRVYQNEIKKNNYGFKKKKRANKIIWAFYAAALLYVVFIFILYYFKHQ